MMWLMGKKRKCSTALVLVAVFLCIFSSATWAAACDAVFPNGVQSHASNGNVALLYQSEISGGGSILSTPSLSTEQQVTCGGSTCVASGSPAAASNPSFSTGVGADGSINAAGPSGNNTDVNAGDYGSVNVVQRRILTFDTTDGLYLMESLTSNFQSEIRFRSGDYWINGDMNIGQETVLRQIGGGTVRIFVDGNVSLGYQVRSANFSAGELLVYATGNITFADQVRISGFVYAGGQFQAGYRTEISGAVSASTATLNNEVTISYVGDVLSSVNFEPFCGQPAMPSLEAYWAMDELQWNGTAGEVLDSSGNGNNGNAQNGADTAGDSPAISGDPGTCRYGEFDGTDDYVEVPGISNTLNATASMAFWIRTNQSGNNTVWEAPGVTGVELAGGTDDIFWGWLDASGRIGISVGNNNNTRSNVAINNGSWRHVVLTRDHQAGTYKIYVDGALDTSGSIATGVIGTGYDGLGRVRDTGGDHNYLDGDLDEVRIYSGILTDDQVSDLMQETHPCADQLCPVAGQGPTGGLLGDYYNQLNFGGGIIGQRADGPINFDWGSGAPGVSGIAANQFSIEWNGLLRITEAGAYRFQTVSDDGVRLWIDSDGDGTEEQLINNWTDHARQTNTSGSVSLTAGQIIPIRMRFYENGGQAEIRLRWSTPSSGNFVPIPEGPTPVVGSGLYHCVSNAPSSYALSHSPVGITCEAEPVTITALDSSGNPMVPPTGTQIVLDTSPAATPGWFDTNTYIFSGSETSTIKYLSQTSPATLDISVSDGNAGGTSGPIEFADAGLRFYGDSTLNPIPPPIPSQVAGVEENNLVVRAVETNTDTGACEARVQGGQTINLGYECRNPTSCVAGQTLSLATTVVQANDAGTGPNYAPVNVTFDSEGFASIPFEYSDVGQIRLLGSLDVPASAEDPAVTLTGVSSEFVVKPHTLVLVSAEDAAGNASPGTTSGGSGFVAAGETFTAVVEARNADDNPTPNFGNESTPQTARVDLSNLVYPSGGSLGSLAGGNSFAPGGAPAQQENSSLSWNNVGSITLTPRLLGDDYLGAGDLVIQSESDPIGRFYPHDFTLAAASVNHACGSFSYMNQGAIELNFTLVARALGGAIVSNYDEGLGYNGTASMAYVAENADAGDGASLGGRVNVDQTGISWGAGQLNILDPGAFFARQGSGAPDGPYSALQWGSYILAEEDNRPLVNLDMNAATGGDCVAAGNCDAVALGGTQDLRYGRLVVEDAYGPEVLDLPAPFYTEYWDGNGFVRSVADNCTEIPRSAISYPDGSIATDANLTVSIGGGTSTGSYSNLASTSVDFSSGNAGQLFSAPGAGNTGSFEVEVDLQTLPWLRFDWSQNGTYDNDPPPTRIGFGSYRGHDRVIYWREVFE